MMISVMQAHKSFGTRALWSNINFEVTQGQMFAIVGPSGSGKSTLLNCLGTLESFDSGQVLVYGKNIVNNSSRQRRLLRRDVLGYLFQDYALIDNASVAYNLSIAARSAQKKEYEKALDRVGLAGRSKEKVFRLSGGEQQRVALARLMVKQPRIVLADEPTGALDHGNADMVVEVLKDMSKNGVAVVIATHNDHVVQACDSVLDLSKTVN
ncbi:MAG: ATP-binding cassette domain-containing protein [Mycobacteriaceae bacterium]